MSAAYPYGRQQSQGDIGRGGGGTPGSHNDTLSRTQVPARRGAQFIQARGRLESSDSAFDGRSSPGTLNKRTAKSQERLNSTTSSSNVNNGSRGGNLSQQKHNAQSMGNVHTMGQQGQSPQSQQGFRNNDGPPHSQGPPHHQQQGPPINQQGPLHHQQQGPPHPQSPQQPISPIYNNQHNYSNINIQPQNYNATPAINNNNNYDQRNFPPNDTHDKDIMRGNPVSNLPQTTRLSDSSSIQQNNSVLQHSRNNESMQQHSRVGNDSSYHTSRIGDGSLHQNSRVEDSIIHSRNNDSVHNNSTRTNNITGGVTDTQLHEFEKVRLENLQRGKLYEDTLFLPTDSSLYFSRHPPYDFEWRRAKDIAQLNGQKPSFSSNGVSRFDVRQGRLGDCWLVASIACLSMPEYKTLFDRVVPPDQNFQEGWYSGVFRFNFWHFGQWKQVVVDDLLPTIRGQLAFISSEQSNEFWAALLEKAYAKLYGSYEALKSGVMRDALTDLTGGLTETYNFKGPQADLPENIVNILFKALERQSLIGCAIHNKGSGESVRPDGLVEGHAYSVTDLRRIMQGQDPVTLIRIRNPHGNKTEWNGRWSEWSPQWQQIAPQDRDRLGLVKREDGEFWMDFEDFVGHFDSLDICNLTPDAPVDTQRKWVSVEHHGRWMKNFNAGGRPGAKAHWANPQYLMSLEDTDEDEDNVCSVVVQLMQKDRRKIKHKGENFLYIGFTIYQYEKGYPIPLRKDFFETHKAVASAGNFVNSRQMSKRLSLPPGQYVVVPSTWETDEEADYYLRFFFEKGHVAEYLDEKPGPPEIPPHTPSKDWSEQEDSFKAFFYRISGEDMEVNAFELREAINEGLKKDPVHRDISIDACKSFVNLMDVDGSGRLSFFEFQFLWHHLRNWKKSFYQFDANKSGSLDSRELRAALSGAGFKVGHKSLVRLIQRYADDNGRITLDDFLALMARLMKTFNVFNNSQKDGIASLSMEEWLERTIIF